MKYFECVGYNKEQNKKDLTWEEVRNLPIYTITGSGQLWKANQKVSKDVLNKPCYIVKVSSKPIALYFFEKAIFGDKKGVKLHLIQMTFSRAKDNYYLSPTNDRWVFITPDWKVYNMDGNLVKIKSLGNNERNAPSYYDFQLFRSRAHDLRIIGQFGDSFSCEQLFSPATVEILKEVGFDMDTRMMSHWQIKYSTGIPEDSYSTEWFVENLIHPNRVARRKKENSSIHHDYKYYCDLMGEKNFLVFEEEGQIYVAQKSLRRYYSCKGITVSYLKMQNHKEPSCVYYSANGAKKLKSNTINRVIDYEYDSIKEACENTIDQLLDKRQMLEKTEVFKNLIPTLEKARETLNNCTLSGDNGRFIFKMYDNLSYILSPVGQKDKVNEEFVKEKGLENGISASHFLQTLGDFYTKPNFKQKTPYGQVGLTKAVYYNLKKFVKVNIFFNFRGMIKGLIPPTEVWGNSMTKEEFLAARLEFMPYLTADFLDLLSKLSSDTAKYPSYAEGVWESILKLAGGNSSSPLSEKIAAIKRLLKKLDSEASLIDFNSAISNYFVLTDYYRQVDELAPLGMNWPQKYEEFRVKNIMWFLGTIREDSNIINWAKDNIPGASVGRRIAILHEIQNQISAVREVASENPALQQMDKDYAPWKEQLKKALEWKGQNLGIFIPESLAELTKESDFLHHCVRSYKKDVSLRKQGVLFLRKLSCSDTPYYTIDVVKKPNGKYIIRQCLGICNINPTPEIVKVLKQWAADTGKKAHMPKNEFAEAMASGNPGNYILEHYSANNTLTKECLDYLSVDEALCLVNDSVSNFCIPGRQRYYIEICMQNITIDTDHTYIAQSKWFDTEAEAVAWYKNSFDYIGSKYCCSYLMIAQFYQNQGYEDYDIIGSKKLKNI